MRKDELTGRLRQSYDAKRGFGLARADRPGYENIWFVVPPPPPRELPKNLPLKSLAADDLRGPDAPLSVGIRGG